MGTEGTGVTDPGYTPNIPGLTPGATLDPAVSDRGYIRNQPKATGGCIGELQGWTLTEPARTFRGDDLFELIDGGAELYHEYGFEQAVASRYEQGSLGLQIEVYRMQSPAAAYGVYSLMQSAKATAVDVGQAAQLFRDYLVFWKGRHYVSLTLTGASEAAAAELVRVGRTLAAGIGETAPPPELLGALPAKGLRETRYVRGPIALSNVYVFGSGNVFGVTEAVCGFYPGVRRFVFAYASDEQAAERLDGAAATLSADAGYRDFQRRGDGFECIDADGRQLAAEAQGAQIVVTLAEAGGRR